VIINNVELWGHERDPAHPPEAVHRHTLEHRGRIACDLISFKAAVELAGDHVTEIHDHGFADDYDPLAA
jgi:hypothetical protein